MPAMLNKILSFVFQHEGGYVNNPNDPGGATNMGITQRVYDNYRTGKSLPTLSVKSMPAEDAVDIYYNQYWDPSWEALGLPLASCCMDTAVNMGPKRARQFLQACNGDYVNYLQQRIAKYTELIHVNPNLAVFKNGWMNRVTDLRRWIEINKDA